MKRTSSLRRAALFAAVIPVSFFSATPLLAHSGGWGSGSGNTGTIDYAVVGGGVANTSSGGKSFIGGGQYNVASGTSAVAAGGNGNTASGDHAFVGGGYVNKASGYYASLGGGFTNQASGTYSVVGGGWGNAASGERAVVGGGQGNAVSGNYSSILGGSGNTASGLSATVAGGGGNTAGGELAFVGGGLFNAANGYCSSVSGGNYNAARANYAFLGGGWSNVITTNGTNSVLGGGTLNTIAGRFAFLGGGANNTANGAWYPTVSGGWANAANQNFATVPGGARGKALHPGSFVWSGVNTVDTVSTNANSFTVRAPGGVRFITATNNALSGVRVLPNATAWTVLSDRESKTDFQPIKPREVLSRLASMPVTTWKYKHDPSRRYIGPTSQDFMAAFHLGDYDKGINTLDADGVVFAAIQGLVEELQARDKAMAERDKTIEELKTKNTELSRSIEAIHQRLNLLPPDR